MKYHRPAISPGYILPNINPKRTLVEGRVLRLVYLPYLGKNISDILHVFLMTTVFFQICDLPILMEHFNYIYLVPLLMNF